MSLTYRFPHFALLNHLSFSAVCYSSFTLYNVNMAPIVERLSDTTFELGEGPHWDNQSQCLYFVDIFGKTINRYSPVSKQFTKASVGKCVGFIVPVEGTSDQFVVGLDRDLCIVTWDGVSSQVLKIEKIAEVDNKSDTVGNRFNDGKVDPVGRLWAGTMGAEPVVGQVVPNKGSLFSYDNCTQVRSHLSNIHISNGLAWSHDHKKFYYIDSGERRVDQFDYNSTIGVISNRQPLFTFEKNGIEGFPDGQTIDSDGNLWIAVFNGSKIIKIDSNRPEALLQVVDIPALQVTSVTFGGANFDELYVTTARMLRNDDTDAIMNQPEQGALYRIKNLGVKACAAINFRK